METKHLIILMFIAFPFILKWVIVTVAIRIGFFITKPKPTIKKKDQIYFDKLTLKHTKFILILLCILSVSILYFKFNATYFDILIVITLWASQISFYMVYNQFQLLQDFAWKDYFHFPDKNKKEKPNRFRFYYPVPSIDKKRLLTEPVASDTEMMYLYKLIHFKNLNSWGKLQKEIRKKCFHGFRRQLLYSTTGKVRQTVVCKSWKKWEIKNITPVRILQELKLKKDFNDFAQCWHSYAILVSRQTIKNTRNFLYSIYFHIVLFLIAFAIYFLFTNFTYSLSNVLSGFLFSISMVCSIVYAIVALMLYIYGKVIALDDLYLPIDKMGDPFFRKSSKTAITLSVSTALTVGVGLPISLFETGQLAMYSAGLAGIFTAGVFFVSVWGTHFSMENTKDRALNNIINKIKKCKNNIEVEIYKIKYSEISKVPIWPINFVVGTNIVIAVILPILFQELLKLVVN